MWTETTAFSLPRENVKVMTMDSGGHEQVLIRQGNLWWVEDKSMYVYYVPKRWKYL